MPKLIKVCAHCGSTNVMHDAWAMWDVGTQEYVLSQHFDAGYCSDCGGETRIQDADMLGPIKTVNTCPPIPIRSEDWHATRGDYDLGAKVGAGATEEAAIVALLELECDDTEEHIKFGYECDCGERYTETQEVLDCRSANHAAATAPEPTPREKRLEEMVRALLGASELNSDEMEPETLAAIDAAEEILSNAAPPPPRPAITISAKTRAVIADLAENEC